MAWLTSLQNLAFPSLEGDERASLDLRPLGHLSRLALLERLELISITPAHDLPPGLLPALGRLTSLDLAVLGSRNADMPCPGLPGGMGTALRELRLVGVGITAAAEQMTGPISPSYLLEQLSLLVVWFTTTLWGALPQPAGLTALGIHAAFGSLDEERVGPALARCARLVELDLGGLWQPQELPPGSLQQLTRLTLRWRRGWLPWPGLARLRRLRLENHDPFAPM